MVLYIILSLLYHTFFCILFGVPSLHLTFLMFCISRHIIQELQLAHKKESLPFKEDMEPERSTEPNGSPEEDWKGTSGGYDCKFVKPPPSAFQTECPVCHLPLRDPYQATCCGTSFCCSCIEQLRTGNNLCPTCRKDNFKVSPNKGLKRSLNQLQVFCTHRKDGCTWTGELGELDHHLIKVIHSGKSLHCKDHQAQWEAFCS